MEIKIETLEGDEINVELEEVGAVYADDDVIYFAGVPCRLSSARAEVANLDRKNAIRIIVENLFNAI